MNDYKEEDEDIPMDFVTDNILEDYKEINNPQNENNKIYKEQNDKDLAETPDLTNKFQSYNENIDITEDDYINYPEKDNLAIKDLYGVSNVPDRNDIHTPSLGIEPKNQEKYYENEVDEIPNNINQDENELKNSKNYINISQHSFRSQKKLFSKNNNCSINELRIKIREINKKILNCYDEKEKAKSKLNSIYKNLNELISMNSEIEYYKEKQKLLENSRKKNKSSQLEYNSLKEKIKKRESIEKDRINNIENNLDNIKIENKILNKKIDELKSKFNLQNKELEICISNKKYPKKIFSCSQDVNSLSSKKYEIHHKIIKNKNELENLIKTMKKLQDMYNANIKEDTNETIINKINDIMIVLNDDLSGNIDDIFNKIDNDKCKILHFCKDKDKKNNNMPLLDKYNNIMKSSDNLFLNAGCNSNNYHNRNTNNNHHVGIFSKYSFLQKNNSSSYIKNLKSPYSNDLSSNSSSNRLKIKVDDINKNKVKAFPNRIIKNKNFSTNLNTSIEEKNDTKNDEELLNKDYINATDNDYKELLHKQKEYTMINERLEKTKKDYLKMADKKTKDVSNNIEINKKKLEGIMQANELLKKDVKMLYRLHQLTKEQQKLITEQKIDQIINKKILLSKHLTEKTENDSFSDNYFLNELNNIYIKGKGISYENNVKDDKIKKKIVPNLPISLVKSNENDGISSLRDERIEKIKLKYTNKDTNLNNNTYSNTSLNNKGNNIKIDLEKNMEKK